MELLRLRELSQTSKKSAEPKFSVELERNRFLVKTIGVGPELEEVLRFRYKIFSAEYGITSEYGIDIDRFDLICDHLVIIDREPKTGGGPRLVGTYRLIASQFSDSFYSQTEFQLDRFLALPGNKLELGRLCIDEDYRNGVIMALLWRGVAEYARVSESHYMFGCSSVRTMDLNEVGAICNNFTKAQYALTELGIQPLEKYRIPELPEVQKQVALNSSVVDDAAVMEKVPALLISYLKAGAMICPNPALDRDFKCVDFLTVLKMDQINALYGNRFNVVS